MWTSTRLQRPEPQWCFGSRLWSGKGVRAPTPTMSTVGGLGTLGSKLPNTGILRARPCPHPWTLRGQEWGQTSHEEYRCSGALPPPFAGAPGGRHRRGRSSSSFAYPQPASKAPLRFGRCNRVLVHIHAGTSFYSLRASAPQTPSRLGGLPPPPTHRISGGLGGGRPPTRCFSGGREHPRD